MSQVNFTLYNVHGIQTHANCMCGGIYNRVESRGTSRYMFEVQLLQGTCAGIKFNPGTVLATAYYVTLVAEGPS